MKRIMIDPAVGPVDYTAHNPFVCIGVAVAALAVITAVSYKIASK